MIFKMLFNNFKFNIRQVSDLTKSKLVKYPLADPIHSKVNKNMTLIIFIIELHINC